MADPNCHSFLKQFRIKLYRVTAETSLKGIRPTFVPYPIIYMMQINT